MGNRPDCWVTTARAHDAQRVALWEDIFGRNEAPIVSLIPDVIQLEGEDTLVYWLDIEAITEEQKDRLVEVTARAFGADPVEMGEFVDSVGMPIRARGVTASTTDDRVMAMLTG